MGAATYTTSDALILLRAEHAVARLLAEAPALPESYPQILGAIAEALGWELAAAWELDPDEPSEKLRRAAFWHSTDIEIDALAEIRAWDRLPIGHGLPGRVWASGEPA